MRVVRILEERRESSFGSLDILRHSLNCIHRPTVRRELGERESDESEQLKHTQDDEENHPALTPGRNGAFPGDPSFRQMSSFHPGLHLEVRHELLETACQQPRARGMLAGSKR